MIGWVGEHSTRYILDERHANAWRLLTSTDTAQRTDSNGACSFHPSLQELGIAMEARLCEALMSGDSRSGLSLATRAEEQSLMKDGESVSK